MLGWPLLCPLLVRPLLVEIKFRPGAQGPCTIAWWRRALLTASLEPGVARVSPAGDWHASVVRWDVPSCLLTANPLLMG